MWLGEGCAEGSRSLVASVAHRARSSSENRRQSRIPIGTKPVLLSTKLVDAYLVKEQYLVVALNHAAGLGSPITHETLGSE